MTPLVPAGVDLRDFQFMPLDVLRLRDSDLAARVTGEEFRAAVLLWCAAWHQQPAASLPDDDVVLSALAGFGRVIKEWLAVKSGALRGWVKCDDGRLYHPVVAEKANEAWLQKQTFAWRRECDRIRKENVARAKSGKKALEFPARPAALPTEVGEFPTEVVEFPQEVGEASAGIPTENALNGTDQTGTDRSKVIISFSPSITAPPRKERGDILDCIEKVLSAYPRSRHNSQPKALDAIAATPVADWPLLILGCAAYALDFKAKPTTHPIALDRFIRERIFDNYAPRAAAAPALHAVEHDSPAGRAWDAHERLVKGRPPPWTNGRWHFAAPFPPTPEPANETRQ